MRFNSWTRLCVSRTRQKNSQVTQPTPQCWWNLPVEKSAKAEAHNEGGKGAAANEDERDLAVWVFEQRLHRVRRGEEEVAFPPFSSLSSPVHTPFQSQSVKIKMPRSLDLLFHLLSSTYCHVSFTPRHHHTQCTSLLLVHSHTPQFPLFFIVASMSWMMVIYL